MHWKTKEDLKQGLIIGLLVSSIWLMFLWSVHPLNDITVNPVIFGERR